MNRRFPKSVTTVTYLYERFGDEKTCRDFMFGLRFARGFVCPHCGDSRFGKIESRGLYRCKGCRKQISPTSGTFMNGTHIKLRLWIIAAYLFMTDKGGMSAVNLMRNLGVTYKTAWFMLHRFRKAMKTREERYVLDGIVEFDDTYLGGPTHGKKRGRGTEKTKVMVALSVTENHKSRYVKMVSVPNLKGITVGKFAEKNVKAGSIIESDNASSYKKPLADKYFHHFKTYDATDGDLKELHIMISNMKRMINGTYFSISPKHTDLYLAEFCYRFNRRSSGELNYQNLLAALVQ
jgi:hypothetical protein